MNSAARHQELTKPRCLSRRRSSHLSGTSGPWSRHYRAGFLASDRYCWWKQHLSEWRPAKISILIFQPTGRRRHARESFALVIKAG
jgi:hypothetical protein